MLVDDASADYVYSRVEYVRQKRSKSILCLPIVKQAKLAGALYLENNMAPGAFTPGRVTVLQLLASQAAISIENAGFYSDLQKAEQDFRLNVDTVPGFLCTMTGRGEFEFANQGILDYTGFTLEQMADWRPLLHPDERAMVTARWIRSVETGDPYDIEHRVLGADGIYRWFLVRGLPARDGEGVLVRWYILITDIDERKKTHEDLRRSEAFLAQGQSISRPRGRELFRQPGLRGHVMDITAAKKAEEKIRQSEKEARQLLDLSPLHITELGADGARLYTNRVSLDYYGITLKEWQDEDLRKLLHPQDAGSVTADLPGKLQSGSAFEYEARLKRKDGQYRWFHYRLSPMTDDEGRTTRWYAAGTDINDRKQAEQRLHEENVALREEIDKPSMFEEIVGTSAPLKNVLSRIAARAICDCTPENIARVTIGSTTQILKVASHSHF